MALPYSTLFINVAGLTGPVDFTCPHGKVMIVRDIDVFAGVSGSGATYHARDKTSGATFDFYLFQGLIQEVHQWRGRQVFTEGFVFEVTASIAPIDVRASGYILSA